MLSLGTEWDQEPLILQSRGDHPKRFVRFTEPAPRAPVPKVVFLTLVRPQNDFLAQQNREGDRSMRDPRGMVRVGKDKITCFELLSTATEVDNRELPRMHDP